MAEKMVHGGGFQISRALGPILGRWEVTPGQDWDWCLQGGGGCTCPGEGLN